MRYSKSKKITIAIISFICVLFVGFIIYKGIADSMKISDNAEPTKSKSDVFASVSKLTKKITKKKDTKKETKKEENKVTKSTKDEKVKVVSKKSVTKKEEPQDDGFTDERDDGLVGTYTITSLKIGDKKYTNSEIKKLKDNGYSLELEMNKDGTANVSVLYINKLYAYDNDCFQDGTNRIEYTKKGSKLKIKIDDAEMVFKKN